MLSLLPSDITEQCTVKALNIFSLTSCSCTYTQIQLRAWKELTWNSLTLPWTFSLSLFLPYCHLSCSPRVMSAVVQVSYSVSSTQHRAAGSVANAAGASRIVLQSSTRCGSLSNVLSNHCLTVSWAYVWRRNKYFRRWNENGALPCSSLPSALASVAAISLVFLLSLFLHWPALENLSSHLSAATCWPYEESQTYILGVLHPKTSRWHHLKSKKYGKTILYLVISKTM